MPGGKYFTRDVTQAYKHSNTQLEREVYILAQPELKFSQDTVQNAVPPLHGIPELGLYWYLKYLEHHIQSIFMHQSTIYPCVLKKRDNSGLLCGVLILQVDDRFLFWNR